MSVLRNLSRSPVAIGLLLLGCIGVVYVGASFSVQSRLPADGVLLTELSAAGVRVTVQVSPTPGNLRRGDSVLEIDGRSIWDWAEQALVGPWEEGDGISSTGWEVGQEITYRVERDGEEIEVPVILVSFPLGRLPVVRAGTYALLLVSLAVASYVLLARPYDVAARLLFAVGLGLFVPLALHFHSAVLTAPRLFLIESIIKFLTNGLLFSAFLHFFLIFPAAKPGLQGREKWLNGLHLVNPLLSVGAGLLFAQTPIERFLLAWGVNSWIGLLMLLGGIISIVHTYVTVRQAAVRSQVRWIIWGCVMGLLPYILFTQLPDVITGHSFLSIEITAFFVVILPITIAIAIARYRLFDIDTLIHRSLIYGFLLLLLGGIYLLLVAVIGAVVVRITGRPNDTAVVFISTLITSFGFWSLHRRMARVVARIFYRTRVEPSILLAEISELVSHSIDLGQIEDLLARWVPERLGAFGGALMVLSPDRKYLEAMSGDPLVLPLTDIQEAWADHQGEPILYAMPPAWFPADALDLMKERQVELLYPLLVVNKLVGLWSLGPRRSGFSYTTEETRMLSTVARQVAVAVQNALLVDRLKVHGQQMEEMVQHRTRDLEGERNRLNVILQNMVDGLMVTGPDAKVLLVNPAFEELVHVPARELLGQSLEAAKFPELEALVAEAMAEKAGRVHAANLGLHGRVLQTSVSVLHDRSSAITVLRDVTHEVEVDRMKSEFISTVSHELRTPLTSVLGFAKLIRRTLDRSILPELSHEAHVQKAVQRIDENLDIIVSEGERLTRLINDVLDIAKMESGKVEWHDQPIVIGDLVSKVLQTMGANSPKKGLELVQEVADDLPLLFADPDRIQQVLNNLVSNALKFTDQGRVSVAVQYLAPGTEVGQWKPADSETPAVLFSVQDTGVGITPGDLDRLFLRFQQLSSDPLTAKPSGTGLGLAICREIVLHYGGAIWAESDFGQGATFVFVLPLLPFDEAAATRVLATPQKVAPAPVLDRSVCILVADDEPHIRELLKLTLEEAGHDVLTAMDGSEAVERARRDRPDLIMLDVMMPGISGLDVLKILKSDPMTLDIPVIILSMVETRGEGLALGADAYLTKPLDGRALLDTIARLLVSAEGDEVPFSPGDPLRTPIPQPKKKIE